MADGAGAAEINPYLNALLHLNDGEPIEWGLLLAGINDLDLLAPMDSEDAAALHAHIVRLCGDGDVRRRRGVGVGMPLAVFGAACARDRSATLRL